MTEDSSVKSDDRIYKALILNDYNDANYATWVYQRLKDVETRYRRTSHRGDLIICKGKTNSVGVNKGMALCMVNLFDCRPMTMGDESAARIHYDPKLFAWPLKDWRYFNRLFEFRHCKVGGTWQGLFDLKLPSDITISNINL